MWNLRNSHNLDRKQAAIPTLGHYIDIWHALNRDSLTKRETPGLQIQKRERESYELESARPFHSLADSTGSPISQYLWIKGYTRSRVTIIPTLYTARFESPVFEAMPLKTDTQVMIFPTYATQTSRSSYSSTGRWRGWRLVNNPLFEWMA